MNRITRFTLLLCLPCLLSIFSACKTSSSSNSDFKPMLEQSKEIDYDAAKQKQIVERISGGNLLPDSTGAVALPADLASAAKYGYAYVTQKDNGQILILVPTWRGKGSNVKGYLHCKYPLQAGDKHTDSYGKEAIDVNIPVGNATKAIEVQILRVVDDKTLYVYRGLD